MEFLTTKIKLKPDITKEKIWELIELWLTGSQHYGISNVEMFGQENIHEQLFKDSSLQSITFNLGNEEILACRFEVSEPDNTWRTDCIYSAIGIEKSLTINLTCSTNKYTSELPKMHKPHIIKLLFDNKFCDTTGIFPICDTPIILDNNTLDKCAGVMNGELSSDLPIVYISYDYKTREHYPVDREELAIRLSGLSHVLVEPNVSFSRELSQKTNKKNTFMGYIGIYYPDTPYREVVSFFDHMNDGIINTQTLMNEIYHTVRRAAVNHIKVGSRTWANVLLAYQKQKLLMAVNNTNDIQKELEEANELIKMYDDENRANSEKIRELTAQLDSKIAQIELLKNKHNNGDLSLNRGAQSDYYMNEAYDFIVTLLSYVAERIPNNTRPKDIITEIIKANPPTNYAKTIFADIKDALKSPLTERRKKLVSCGFEYDGKKHDKIATPDGKYIFSLANSGSDFREAENTYSDMMKKIDIYKNFL